MISLKSLICILPIMSICFIGCGESESTTIKPDQISIDKAIKTRSLLMLRTINKARNEERNCYDGKGVVGPSFPLTWSEELYASALEHSIDLAMSDTFEHLGSGTKFDTTGKEYGHKSHFKERIQKNNYINYSIVGENIAAGQGTIEKVINEWLESPLHCQNIMNNDFSEVGIAVSGNIDSYYGLYWTQNLGTK